MTVVTLEPDPLKDIADLEVRIFNLENSRGGQAFDANGAPIFPSGITIGDSAPIYVDEPVPPPTGLMLSWNSNFDEIFIDASWTPPASTQVTTYMVELTKVTGGVGVIDAQGGLGANSYRFRGLEPNTQYSVRVWSYNRLGAPGTATAPVTINTGTDATLPAAPTGLIVTAGLKALVARWTDNTEVDVARGKGLYEIQVATDAAFTLNLRTFRESATIMSVGDLTTGTTYYLKVRAIDSSGNFSLFSSTANVTPAGTQTGDYGALSIDDAAIANLSAAKVTFGTMSGDRITANTMDLNRLKTSTLDVQIITIAGTGMLRIGRTVTPFHYLLEDSAGIRFFQFGSAAFTGGTLIGDFNVNTGGISIIGTITAGLIRTGASGQRIEMSSSAVDTLWLYTGHASETRTARLMSALAEGGDHLAIWLQGPQSNADSRWAEYMAQSTQGELAAAEMRTWSAGAIKAVWHVEENNIYGILNDDNTGRHIILDSGGAQLGYSTGGLRFRANSTELQLINASNINAIKVATRVTYGAHIEMRGWQIRFSTADNDTNHLIVYDAAFDAPVHQGFSDTFMCSINNNSAFLCAPGETASVDFGNNNFINHHALNLIPSDMVFKADVGPLERAKVESYFRGTRAKRFKRKAEMAEARAGESARDHWGFVAQDWPEEFRRVSTALFDEHSDEEWERIRAGEMKPRRKETLSYDPQAVMAVMWEMLHVLDERLDAIEAGP